MRAFFGSSRLLRALLPVLLVVPFGVFGFGATATSAATPPELNLRVLLIGSGTGSPSSDPTTAAWESALSTEGVAYTEVAATGTAPSQTVTLPTLSSGTVGNFNGVVIADDPADFAAGQLTALDTYESTFGVRQVDGYTFPSTAVPLGLTDVSSVALDGTTGALTTAGLSVFPGLAGPVPFSTGTHGYPSTVNAGAPFTPLLEDTSGDVLAGIYQHPATDAQANVAEMVLTFNYNASQLQWELLAPGLINWVTNDMHLGLTRNYVEMDIDDTFTPDDAWDTTTHSIDYTDTDSLRMNPSDVTYAADWSQANNFRMDQLFNFGSSVAAQTGGLIYDGAPTTSNGTDPLLAAFQAKNPLNNNLPYSDSFGWLSHTYDTPYLDVGCATQNYIEAELNENTSSIAAAPGATAGTGGLGLTESTNTADALGYENPQVFVPGNHSGFADLVPGTPATVDPPDLNDNTVTATGGTLPAGTYEYAVTDQFAAGGGESQADVTDPITITAGETVNVNWEAICHAANYNLYRENTADPGVWTQIGTYSTPSSATLPDNSSGNPTSATNVSGGGELQLTFPDTGATSGTDGSITYLNTPEATGWTPPTTENAVESPWEQNPYFVPALEAVGITAVGDDASKAYPNPPDDQFGIGATYTGATYAAGSTFVDGTAQVVPRHPINIFYNATTEAQEVDEYNTLYEAVGDGSGTCVASGTTTCLTTPATFSDIVSSIVSGMFQNILSNNPDPTYVHQTNLMGAAPGCTSPSTVCNAAPPATTPATADTTGDGLLYSVLNPLLAEYNSYFNANTPYEQATLGAIGSILADQTAWTTALGASQITATETNGVVSVTNKGTSAINVPVTMPPGSTVAGAAYGQAYGGALSTWTSVAPSATLTLVAPAPVITSAATTTAVVGTAFSFSVTTTGTPIPVLSTTGTLPSGVTAVANANGTVTISGTPGAGTAGSYPLVITATNTYGTATQSFDLVVDAVPPPVTTPPPPPITVTPPPVVVTTPAPVSTVSTGTPLATTVTSAKCSLAVTSSKLLVTKALVPLTVRYSGGKCSGTFALTARKVVKASKGAKTIAKVTTITLARAAFTVTTAQVRKVSLQLTGLGKTYFANAKKHPVKVTLTATAQGLKNMTMSVVVR